MMALTKYVRDIPYVVYYVLIHGLILQLTKRQRKIDLVCFADPNEKKNI